MPHTRREFVVGGLAGAAGVSLWPRALLSGPGRERAPLRVLILGGTGFLGPHCVEACLARGHHLTLFNRGRTERVTGHSFEGEEGIERRFGNRDPEMRALEGAPEGPDNPLGLEQLAAGEWDAVLDTSGYWPRIVEASASLLADRVGQYVFISTISVYAGHAEVGADTSAPLGTMDDPTVEDFGANFENYGPAKALCERAAERAMPGRVTNLRPGLIVGPGDNTGRFTYWPVRVDRGGEVLAPGTPEDPIQLIDVRDLAAWVVHCMEEKVVGTFDAVGPPAPELTMGGLIGACQGASERASRVTWCDADFLESEGVSPWGDMPVWMPPRGETAGFHQRDVSRSLAMGLRLRPIGQTCADTLAWYRSLDEGHRFRRLAGLSESREREVLEAWRARGG